MFKDISDKLYSKLLKEETPEGTFYYRKRKVYPVFNEDGSVNWFNLLTGGSWLKLFLTLLVIAILLGAIWEYSANMKQCTEVMADINAYKVAVCSQPHETLKLDRPIVINISDPEQ